MRDTAASEAALLEFAIRKAERGRPRLFASVPSGGKKDRRGDE
jgi:hypothetical protein